MWSPVVSPPDVPDDKVPVSRSKHATVLHGQCLYLLGGRNGNLPMKDFWKYCIGKFIVKLWRCRFVMILFLLLLYQFMLTKSIYVIF